MEVSDDILVLDVSSDSSKYLAKAMSNKKCNLVCEYLELNSNSTKSQISKDLNISLSLLHYTLIYL